MSSCAILCYFILSRVSLRPRTDDVEVSGPEGVSVNIAGIALDDSWVRYIDSIRALAL